MSREEAIRILKLSIENSRNHVRFCFDNKGITALDMAIKALEQEPSVSENPNNCEMRDATLEERESIDKYIKSISKPTGVKFGALEQEPIVTSTEDNAEMIYPQVEGITPTVVNEDIYECSCGYGWDKNKKIRFHFCPNCGKAVGDGNDYKYIKSISNPTGIEFDIDIPKKIESYEKLLKHPVVKHIMDMDEEQEQIDFVRPHKRIPVTLTVSGDLISRQAVLAEIFKKPAWHNSDGSYYHADDIRDAVNSVKPQTGHCKDCKYFEYDSVAKVDGIPLIVAHEICNKWGDGCKTREDGYCFLFEPNMSENPTSSKPEISSYYGLRSYVRERSEE